MESCEDVWLSTPDSLSYGIFCVFLVVLGGVMSGLQQGLFQIKPLDLLALKSEAADSRIYLWVIGKLQQIISQTHLTLVTLLVANSLAMETLPIFMDLIMPKHFAILFSVTLLVLFGEIIPQALCLKFSLRLTIYFTPPLYLLIIILYPVCYPISLMLDYLLGPPSSHSTELKMKRSGLKRMIETNKVDLSVDETEIILGTLKLKKQTARDLMLPIERVFAVNYDDMITKPLLRKLLDTGHSRIPVFSKSNTNFVGILLTKTLPNQNIGQNQNQTQHIRDLQIHPVVKTEASIGLYAMLRQFRTGRSHLAVIEEAGAAIGIVTLEMVIERLINHEIKDEKDEWNSASDRLDRNVYEIRQLKDGFSTFLSNQQVKQGFSYTNGYGSLEQATEV